LLAKRAITRRSWRSTVVHDDLSKQQLFLVGQTDSVVDLCEEIV
jgi:hypothetical protein